MPHPRTYRRVAVGALLACAVVGAAPAMASAASTCTYDPASHQATVTNDASGTAMLKVAVGGGYINVDSTQLCVSPDFQFATPQNTDKLVINEFVTRSEDGVVLDESGGKFAPGFTTEASGKSEIEIEVRRAGGVLDRNQLRIVGTAGDDDVRIRKGQANLDGDDDADLQFGPKSIHVVGGLGDDHLSGQGFGFSEWTNSPLMLDGGKGKDYLFGGTSVDTLAGGEDDDTMFSNADGVADIVSGGLGTDTAYHDQLDWTTGAEYPLY